jgi:dipeptidyl aminopeptidase/acylaminoacyl peptidase
MGGEITLEVLEILKTQPSLASGIKSAAFWAPVTDPVKWFSRTNLPQLQEALITPYPYTETFKILGTPESNSKLWQSLSPLNYLKDINIPILLQHGTGDTTVPYEWSVELNNNLLKLNKSVQFISYPNDNHNLPLSWNQAISEDANFFKSH